MSFSDDSHEDEENKVMNYVVHPKVSGQVVPIHLDSSVKGCSSLSEQPPFIGIWGLYIGSPGRFTHL